MIRITLLTISTIVLITTAKAQKVSNVRATFDGEDIIVVYDLADQQKEGKLSVELYSSHNDYARPLSLVLGDVGEEVKPGIDNRVIWNASKVLPSDFDGEITIKVKASLIMEQVSNKVAVNFALDPLAQDAYKRGTTLNLNWTNPYEKGVKMELMKNGVPVKTLNDRQTQTTYNWNIPKKKLKGSGYAIRLTSLENGVVVSTENFKIKSKLPLVVKILPAVVLAAVLVGTAGGSSGNEGSGNEGLSDLPGPINPN